VARGRAGTVRAGQGAGQQQPDTQAGHGVVQGPDVLAIVPQPAGAEHELRRIAFCFKLRRSRAAVPDRGRQGRQPVHSPGVAGEGAAWRHHRVGCVQATAHQLRPPGEVIRQRIRPHPGPPGGDAGMMNGDDRHRERGLGGQRRAVQLHHLGAGIHRQRGDPSAGGLDILRPSGQPVERQRRLDQPQPRHQPGGPALVLVGQRAEHRQCGLDIVPAGQGGGQIQRIGPDPADRIRRHQQPAGRAHAGLHDASSSLRGSGRSSWMSLK
jgi:hypothetical protein